MIRKSIAIFSLFLLLAPVAYAGGNITFSIPQKDYYFVIGEQAYIPLNITNSYNNDINGILDYTVIHGKNSVTVHFPISTNYTSLQVRKGNSSVYLGFESSDKPDDTFNVSLNFIYYDNGIKVIPLDGFAIHFVENESDKQNQANPMQNSSQEAPTTQQVTDQNTQQEQQVTDQNTQQEQQVTDQNTQQEQQTQQIMQQMMNEQMQKQVQQQQQTQQQSQQQNAANPDSQKYLKQPQDGGSKGVNSTCSRENNTTSLQIQYENPKNETAQNNVRFVNNSDRHIELEREQGERNLLYSLYLIVILIALVLAYLVYKKNNSGKKEQKTLVRENITLHEANFDFKEEAGKLVEKAVSLYSEKQFKDAYGTAAQALRLYLSYKYGLKKEITNSELINYLKSKGVEYEKFDRCLQLSSLVEFAKRMPDDVEFEEMIKTVKNVMKDKNN